MSQRGLRRQHRALVRVDVEATQLDVLAAMIGQVVDAAGVRGNLRRGDRERTLVLRAGRERGLHAGLDIDQQQRAVGDGGIAPHQQLRGRRASSRAQ